MKKKTFIVQLLDSKKPSRTSFTQVEDALFYSNDTDASLVFIPHEDTFDFQSAKVVMFNRGDESLVERDMEVTTEDGRKVASYELPDEIISHWGQWIAQPVFINDDEIYSGAIVPFSVDRHLMHERPPKLTEVVTVTKFVQQSQELVNAMIQAEAQRITEEQARQDSETNRVQAENERSEKYESYSQQFNDVITELSEEKDYHSLPEIAGARGGENTLGERLDKEHNEVTTQLAQTVNFNKAKFYKNPIDESSPISLTVYKDNSGKVITDMHNINELMDMPTTDTGVRYVAPVPFGSFSNDGLTPETPLAISKAVTLEGVHTVFLRGGLYNRGEGGMVGTLTHDKIKLIAYQDEQPILGCSNTYTNWEQHSTNVYKVDRSATMGVYDGAIFDKYGNDYKYNKVDSIDELNSIEGSWYTDGTSVYIRTLDGRVPDDKIKLSIGGNNIKINNPSGNYYFEGITFENGNNAMLVESANIAYFKNCHFRNSNNKAFNVGSSVYIGILEDCMSYGSQTNDGISYNGGVGYFLEINCMSFDNGKESDSSNNNGSTSHGLTGYGIRVNGIYFDNKGPNVADVFGANNESLIWNVGCTAYDSTSPADGGNYDFLTTDITYWEDCVSYGSVNSFGSTEKTSYLRNSIYEKQPTGLIAPY